MASDISSRLWNLLTALHPFNWIKDMEKRKHIVEMRDILASARIYVDHYEGWYS